VTIIRITSPVVFALILCAGAAARAALPRRRSSRQRAPPTHCRGQGARSYRALENAQDPAVKAWSDAQNQRSRAYLDALPYRQAVAAKLAGLTRAASPSWNNLVARGPYIFAIHIDPARQQPTLVTLAANADPATQHMLLDPNALDTGGHTAIDWFVPSQDGSKVAVSLSRNGSEDGTLHVYEVASGKEIDAPIPRVQYPTADGALAWSVDGTGFWYALSGR
jgi:prolyl oligopeptidase